MSWGTPHGTGRRGRLRSFGLDPTKLENWRFFLFGVLVGALGTGFFVSLMTQWVEHGDALYPARSRMSQKGKRVRYDLL